MEFEDGVLIGLFLLCMGMIAAVVTWAILYMNHIDQINDNFTKHCNTLGGHAVIADKDLCIRAGLIVDHEG